MKENALAPPSLGKAQTSAVEDRLLAFDLPAGSPDGTRTPYYGTYDSDPKAYTNCGLNSISTGASVRSVGDE